MRRQRLRWCLTLVGIALGVGSFAGVVAISGAIINSFEKTVANAAGVAQLQISNGTAGVTSDMIETARTVPGVQVASGNVQYAVTVPALRRQITVHGVLLGSDQAHHEAQFGRDVLDLPDALIFLNHQDSIAVTPELLEEAHWTVGSQVEMRGPKGNRTLTVRGRVRPNGALRAFGGDIAVMDSDAAQEAFGELDRFHWIDVVVAPQSDVEEVRETLQNAIGARAIVGTPLGRGRRMEGMLSTLRWLLSASSVIALLVGAFLIQHTVGTAIRQRRADFITLRALGASRRLIASYVLAEICLVGIIGAIAGLAGGIAFAAAAGGVFAESVSAMYLRTPVPSVSLTLRQLVVILLVGEGTVLLAALAPCLGLLRLRPVSARRELRPRVSAIIPWRMTLGAGVLYGMGWFVVHLVPGLGFARGVTAITIFAACMFVGTTLLAPAILTIATPIARRLLRLILGTPGVWSWHQVIRQRFHTATTIGALAAGVTFSIALATLLGSYREGFSNWLREILSADVFVNAGHTVSLLGGPTVNLALAHQLENIEGVARVMPWRFVEVEFRGRPIIVQGVDEVLLARWHPRLSMNENDDEVVVSDTLAERFGLRVGDTIEVRAPREPLKVRIRAVVPDYALDLGSVKLGWKRFSRHFTGDEANLLLVDINPTQSPREIQRRIEAASAGRYDVTVLTAQELRNMVNALIDQSFALTYWLQGLAALVTILAMVNATSAAILDRSEDIVIWRSLGLERRRLVRILSAEAGTLGFFAAVLGVAAGAVVGQMLVRVVAPSVAGFRLPLQWPKSMIAAMLPTTTIAAALAAAFVARSSSARRIGSIGDVT